MKAYSYIRFSTKEQLKGDSKRRQLELSEKYAKEHDLELDTSLKLTDLGVSAYSGAHKHGALGQFLKLVEMDKIEKGSYLLVESFDRLSREDVWEAHTQFVDIVRKGVRVVTLMDGKEYSKETIKNNWSELIFSLSIMSRAHEESATKAKRLKAVWEIKRKQSKVKLTAKAPAWLKLSEDRTKFLPIDDRVKAIKLIFKMKLQGKGKSFIIRQLNSMDLWEQMPDEKKKWEGWRESYVQKILQSRAVIGEFQPYQMIDGKRKPIGATIHDYFPAVIDKDVFYQVQEQIGKIRHKGGRTGNVSNLFTYIVKCFHCRGPMAFVDKGKKPKGGQYLVCDRARRGLGCNKASIKYDEFEHLVLSHCKGLRPQDLLNDNDETAISLLKKEYDGLIGDLASIQKEIDNLADSVQSTRDKRVREIFEKRMIERLDKKDSLNQSKESLQKKIDAESFESVAATLDSLQELLSFLSTATGKKLIDVRLKLRSELQRLINKILVYPAPNQPVTNEMVEMVLKYMSPETIEEYNRCKRELSKLVNFPKKNRFFFIYFASGFERHIYPEHKPQLAMDIDRDQQIIRSWYTDHDGNIVCEEHDKDGNLSIKHNVSL